jgi:hypothetical protein
LPISPETFSIGTEGDLSNPFDLELNAFGAPYHGLATNGSLALPNSTTLAVTQPGNGDVWCLDVPGNPPLNRTTAELANDATLGRTWLDYAIFSGLTRQFYGQDLTVFQAWVWALSVAEKYKVEFSGATSYASHQSSGVLTFHLQLDLTQIGFISATATPVTHTITINQDLPGTWLPAVGSYTYPYETAIKVVDINSDGSSVILAIERQNLDYRSGVFGFVRVDLSVDSGGNYVGAVTVLADYATVQPGLYNVSGNHRWGSWPIWYWFDSADLAKAVMMTYDHYLTQAPADPEQWIISLAVDGVAHSTLSSTWPYGGSTGTTDLDGFNDIGAMNDLQIQGGLAIGGSFSRAINNEPQPGAVNDFSYQYLSSYFIGSSVNFYGASQPAYVEILPIIYSNKSVGLVMKYWQLTLDSSGESPYSPNYVGVQTNQYYGNVLYAGGFDAGVVAHPIGLTQMNGSISGATMTVNSIGSGTVYIGMIVVGEGVAAHTTVNQFLTGSGGTGTYGLTQASGFASSRAMTGMDPAVPKHTTFQPKTGQLARNSIPAICFM